MRICRVCNVKKDEKLFSRGRYICRKCRYVQQKEWAAKNPDIVAKMQECDRFQRALSNGKISARKKGYTPCLALASTLEASFTGYCHCCGIAESACRRRLSIDHNHITGDFRGFLCDNCNMAAAGVRDSKQIALQLAAYLRKYASFEKNP